MSSASASSLGVSSKKDERFASLELKVMTPARPNSFSSSSASSTDHLSVPDTSPRPLTPTSPPDSTTVRFPFDSETGQILADSESDKEKTEPPHDYGVWRTFGIGPVLLSSKINYLLLFGPIALISNFVWSDGATFALSLITMIPLAAMLGFLTEQLAIHTNQTIGGLMNATFGNATELIISIFALKYDMPCIIQQSLLGSILSNVLLVLGSAFLIGGWRYKSQKFSKELAVASASLLLLSVMGLMFPAVLQASDSDRSRDDLALSRFTAFFLLLVYVAYIFFQLKTHKHLFEGTDEDDEEILTFRESFAWLAIVTILISFFSELLVGAIKGAAQDWGCPQIFIGVILLPIVGNAAEHATALTAAYNNRMDMCLGVAIGSSTQIALFGVPFMVIVAWMSGRSLSLYFQAFETAAVFVSTLILSFVTSDGTSNWLSGLMLVVAYILVAAGFFSHRDICV